MSSKMLQFLWYPPKNSISNLLQILTDGETKNQLPPNTQSSFTTLSMERIPESSDEDIKFPEKDNGGLLLYTSGTTGNPKGVLHTHRSLLAQMQSLSEAWEFRSDDVLLHALPLHHIHGIVNALYTPHFNGACVHILPKFNPKSVWSSIQVDQMKNKQNRLIAFRKEGFRCLWESQQCTHICFLMRNICHSKNKKT